jgi:hypothetical protein
MASNAQIILDDSLKHEREITSPDLSPSEFFELFTSEQILKNFGLSYEELDSGIINDKNEKGNDGGIDSFFTFVNGVLVTEDADFENIRQNILIQVFVIQAKTEQGFTDDAILRMEKTVKDLFDISHEDLSIYKKQYHSKLIRVASIFVNTYRKLMGFLPELEISFNYATKGDHIHPNIRPKVEELKKTAIHLFTASKVEFNFLGADELVALARKSKIETLPLKYNESVSTQAQSAVCLVKLKDYYDFIHDSETGELRGWLFEENIRDYEGKNVDVNKQIRSTLENPMPNRDFWWLNNGITIVSSNSPSSGKIFTVTDPKVVNGLQTSMEIYNYFRGTKDETVPREILVRIIVTSDDTIRNEIIKATNSQSAIKAASLRAFDEIHYRIEQYLKVYDFYYERRKNYYKNLKKPKDKIVSIPYLAQAVAAIVLQRPNDSRGRPINLIKNPKHYNSIFPNEKIPIELYLECILFMKKVEGYLNSDEAPSYVRGHVVNVRYQLAMCAAALKAKRLTIKPDKIQTYGLRNVDAKFLTQCLDKVWNLMEKTKKEWDADEDRVAKSPEFDELLKNMLRETISPKLL